MKVNKGYSETVIIKCFVLEFNKDNYIYKISWK